MHKVKFEHGLTRDEVRRVVIAGSTQFADEHGFFGNLEARKQHVFTRTSAGRRRIGLATHEDWFVQFRYEDSKRAPTIAQFAVRSLVDADHAAFGGFPRRTPDEPLDLTEYDFVRIIPSEEQHPEIHPDINTLYCSLAAEAIRGVAQELPSLRSLNA